MTKKNILITGASGMLGKDISECFFSKNEYNVFGVSLDINPNLPEANQFKCSITDYDSIRLILSKIEPDIIINCAALVNLDYCEKNKKDAWELHVNAIKYLIKYSAESTRFIQISTDSVFGGRVGNYSESDRTYPRNWYAKTKRDGEIVLKNSSRQSIIFRTNIYGFHYLNSGNSLFEWAYNMLNSGKKITGFDDVVFNPLYTKQLADIIYEINSQNFIGIINAASEDVISKYDFLRLLLKKFNFSESLLEKSYMKLQKQTINRPFRTNLNTNLLKTILKKSYSINSGIDLLKKDFLKIKYL